MIEQDTIKLLRECDAGVKMGVASIDDVLPHVKSAKFEKLLTDCKEEHEKLNTEIQQLLDKYHDEGKNPNPIAKGMSWMKTNIKLIMHESDHTIADLMTDGCDMGVKSLSKYLNQYDELGWGWTIWSYKIVSVGWWDNSWGLVVNKMFLENDKETPIEDYKLKLDIRKASFEEIMEVWSHEQTKYNGQEGNYKIYEDGTLYLVLKEYFGDKCKIDTTEVVK